MFWGLIMEPNKRYSQLVEKPFHISQAAMDSSTGDNDPCQVMVVVDGKNFLVCTLQKNKCIQVPLDLYFKSGDSISFLTNGKCNVHLTGYLDPEFEEEPSDDEEEEEEEEEALAPAPVATKNKRKLENSNDGAGNKKAKQDKKANKKAVAADSSDSDEEGEDQIQKFLDGEDIDTDENDESFKINTSAETDSSDEDEEDSDEDEGEEEEEEDKDDDDEDEEADKADTTLDTSKEEQIDMSKLSKNQKRKLKKKLQQQQNEPQVNGVDKSKKEKPDQKAPKKKPEAKKDAQVEDKKEKKSLSGGVFIEDLKVGSGPVAKSGKVVMVYYEGRLKQNNKMFDNCNKGPGFKFKLGAKEVISGWDVGVAGMKVGGKRKIVCPPSMAYGAKGSPPVIPPNSTLVFEVELKNVK